MGTCMGGLRARLSWFYGTPCELTENKSMGMFFPFIGICDILAIYAAYWISFGPAYWIRFGHTCHIQVWCAYFFTRIKATHLWQFFKKSWLSLFVAIFLAYVLQFWFRQKTFTVFNYSLSLSVSFFRKILLFLHYLYRVPYQAFIVETHFWEIVSFFLWQILDRTLCAMTYHPISEFGPNM